MSSFVGVLNLDGAPCDGAIIEAMLGRLSHRVTPDGARRASVRCAGPVGLGCAVLPTTPQAQLELENPDAHQVVQQDAAQLWITSDARLDNRAEILAALGAPTQERGASDGRLILAAYARWGEDAPRHLRGDFAGAIWDAGRKRLFCLRDPFGVKPFYYVHVPGRLFAFASEIKALWCVPGTDPSVNPAHIADYLSGYFRDKTSTFYLHAQRLPPATWMSVTPAPDSEPAQIRERLYWELDGQSELAVEGDKAARDQKYADLVRAAFADALEQRMRCDGKLAVFLSGGLDSSSIAALAERAIGTAQQPLTTLSTIFDRFSECDERAYIDQTLGRGAFAPLWMNGDEISPLDDLERIMWHLDGPSPGPNLSSAWAQYRLLQEAGVSVILDGHGGDEIISKGYERVGELLFGRRFATAWRELRLLYRHGIVADSPTLQVGSALLWHARDQRGWGRAARVLRRALARRAQKSDGLSQLKAASLDVMAPACRALVEAPAPAPSWERARAHHAHDIAGPLQPLALEGLDAVAGAHALEARFPFWEQHLAQLCVSLPADQKLRAGHNRYVMRRAMEGLLAPAVQWRRTKTDFAPQIIALLREREAARLEAFFALAEDANLGLENYLDMEQVRLLWQQLQEMPPDSPQAAAPAFVLWRAFCVGMWLAAQPPRPAAPPAAPAASH